MCRGRAKIRVAEGSLLTVPVLPLVRATGHRDGGACCIIESHGSGGRVAGPHCETVSAGRSTGAREDLQVPPANVGALGPVACGVGPPRHEARCLLYTSPS